MWRPTGGFKKHTGALSVELDIGHKCLNQLSKDLKHIKFRCTITVSTLTVCKFTQHVKKLENYFRLSFKRCENIDTVEQVDIYSCHLCSCKHALG